MKDNRNIDNLFSTRLEHHQVPPPAGVWESVESSLPPNDVSGIRGIFRKPVYTRLLAFLAVFGGLTIAAVLLKSNATSRPTPVQQHLTDAGVVHGEKSILLNNNDETSSPLAGETSISETAGSEAASFEITNGTSGKAAEANTISSGPMSEVTSAPVSQLTTNEKISLTTESSIHNNLVSNIVPIAPSEYVLTNSGFAGQNAVPVQSVSTLTAADLDRGPEHVLAASGLTALPSTFPELQTGEFSSTGWYAGAFASVQYTALLNGKSNGSEDINLDQQSRFGAPAYGLNVGYNFSEHFGLQADLIVDSKQGTYFESTLTFKKETIPVEKRMNLSYTLLPITAKYRQTWHMGPGGIPAIVDYVAGIQYGYLRSSQLSIEEKGVSNTRAFNQHDLAFVLGLDYNLYLGRQFSMTLGARGNISATSLRATELADVNVDKHNVVFGLRGGLQYTFGQGDGY